MHRTVRPAQPRSQDGSGRTFNTSLENPMDTTRSLKHWRDRYSSGLAKRALSDAGPRVHVARILGRAESTIRNECTTRENNAIRSALDIVLRLVVGAGASARAFAEAVLEAVDVGELLLAETETLIARGLYLLPEENRRDALEDDMSLVGAALHADALRAHRDAAGELASIIDVLLLRGVDLHAEYRIRRLS
jgi:hypothetical protein